MNMKNRLVYPLLTVLLLSGCGMAGLPFSGQATDAETGEPLEGVIVVALWRGEVNPIIDSTQVCYHVETSVSDEKGEYRIPGWVGGSWGVMNSFIVTEVYKKGYERVAVNNRYSKNEVKMVAFKGRASERMKHIDSLDISCYSAGDSEKNALILRKALYEEAKSIATTKDDKKIEEGFLFGIEEITYGFDEAEKRRFERMGIAE